ncbi:modification methylase XamI [Bifidobacterium saguini DSM 23967]|uniref:site-specific DNA-methyltransferase (adenine-specific) n=1 Tax=Bifidobacterium saguini DSM 23967 TaxID=1437607 RepID=A0A087D6T9_9BIFI|nr:methyltransferase [Bifidobacterium saguini]KFI91239.1 modification methylase XamI [Bifidobacterium saguini DSM 23967]
MSASLAKTSMSSNEDILRAAESILSGAVPADELSAALAVGRDLLGDAYMICNTAEERRASGSTYTPRPIIEEMVDMALKRIQPSLIVDCGCGSGRYSLACATAFPDSKVLALDNSREAVSMCRANVAASGLSARIEVVQADFTEYEIERPDDGPVLWIGNPPYVRHHDIAPEAKKRFKTVAEQLGLKASGLAGLHVHFLAAIARQWQAGDYGVLVTSSEWMDVNYGVFARELLADRLGLDELRLFDRTSQVFETADTTAVIIGFGGHADKVHVRSSDGDGKIMPLSDFRNSGRWTQLVESKQSNTRHDSGARSGGMVPLGTIARVHRGVVTGNNGFWVRKGPALDGIPEELTVPVVSHAKEIMGECVAQSSPESLSRLIVLPEDTNGLAGNSYEAAMRIIKQGESYGVDAGYVARHRRRWWSIRPPQPPAILMTYMGRGKPTFVVNRQKLPMLNVVHGLYPKVDMTPKAIDRLTSFLNESVDTASGRTYCGGLVKFEPREAESIMVPALEELEA